MIGILLPFYNVENYLKECLDSIKLQTIGIDNLFIYAVNDCSTDNSLEVFKQEKISWSSILVDDRMKRGWNGGYNRAAELALWYGCTELMIMGSDDILDPTCIERMYSLLNHTDSDFCIVTGKSFGEQETSIGSLENAKVEDFRQHNVIANFALIRSKMWTQLGGYDTGMVYSDYDFWIRALQANKKYCVVKEPLYNYRMHTGNVDKKADFNKGYNQILNKYFLN